MKPSELLAELATSHNLQQKSDQEQEREDRATAELRDRLDAFFEDERVKSNVRREIIEGSPIRIFAARMRPTPEINAFLEVYRRPEYQEAYIEIVIGARDNTLAEPGIKCWEIEALTTVGLVNKDGDEEDSFMRFESLKDSGKVLPEDYTLPLLPESDYISSEDVIKICDSLHGAIDFAEMAIAQT